MVTMNRNKVVIVGTGRVGATAAFGIVTHGLCNELVLIDCSAAKALGEARDLDDGSEFQDRHVKVRAGDVCWTPDGEGHSLVCTSDEPLEMIALVVYSS